MEKLLVFVLGIVAVVAIWVWIHRANTRDLQALGSALGLAPPAERTSERLAERGEGSQSKEFEGTLAGEPVEIWLRRVRDGRRLNVYTMVVRPVRGADLPKMLVEPRLRGALLDRRFGNLREANVGDRDFQAHFRVATDGPAWAVHILDAEVRAAMLDLRGRWIGGAASVFTAAADMAAFGWLEIESQRIAFLIPGSPMPVLAPKIKDAVGLLARIARRIQAR